MQERHIRRDIYFEEQAYTTSKHILPFLSAYFTPGSGKSVLEIGCGEGGNIKPFLDAGCDVTGIDILPEKIANAREFYRDHPLKNNLKLITGDIYEDGKHIIERFDLVIMRDVIEHIHDQEKFLVFARRFFKEDGKFFLAFPPWQNPFGGHQQVCRSRLLSKFPYLHLLPGKIYPAVLRIFSEPEPVITGLLEIKDTRISIERFRRIITKEKYTIKKEVFYFINPNYEIKFGLKPRKQFGLISVIPWIRNFFTTSCYYLLSLK